MRRRVYLGTLAAGATGVVGGCMGGKVVQSVQKSVTVPVGRGQIWTIPESGDKIRYIVRDEQPFDVYVFTPDQIQYYRSYLDGTEPEQTPAGERSLGGRATMLKPDLYEVTTDDRGRQSLGIDSKGFFVLDNSGYRGETVPGEETESLTATVDLEVIKSSLPI